MATGTSLSMNSPGVGAPVGHVDQLGNRQQHRDRLSRSDVADLAVGCVGEVLGGNGPLARGGGPALRGFPGVGVDPRREPHVAAQADESLGLGRGEETVLDGDVVELGDALLNHRGQHLIGDEIGVGLPGRGTTVA